MASLWLGVLSSPTRQRLEASHDAAFWGLIIFTGVVAFGVALEILEHKIDLKDAWRELVWLKKLIQSRRKKLGASLASIIVAVGVLGEFWFEWKTGTIDTNLRKFDTTAIAGLEQTVETNKESLLERLEKATQEARLGKEELDASIERFRKQGPRYVLLQKAARVFVKELSPFAGQRAALLICGLYRTERETLETWGSLANILGPDTVGGVKGANWKLVRSGEMWDKCGPSMQGVLVFVSSLAPQKTRDAADALGRALLKTLPRWDDVRIPGVVDADFVKKVIAQGFLDKDDPGRLVTDDPELLVVAFGEHPPQE